MIDFINIDKVTAEDQNGNDLSESDKLAIIINFPMWFGDETVKEINKRGIEVMVTKSLDTGKVYINLVTTDKELISRVQKRFLLFGGFPNSQRT